MSQHPVPTSIFDLVPIEEVGTLARAGWGPDGAADRLIPPFLKDVEPRPRCTIIGADGEAFASCSQEIAAERYAGRPDVSIVTRKPSWQAQAKWRRYLGYRTEIAAEWQRLSDANLVFYRDAAELGPSGFGLLSAVADAVGSTRWRNMAGQTVPWTDQIFGGRGVEFLTPEGRLFLDAGVTRGCVYFSQILVEHKGGGMGGRTMEAIRTYALEHRLDICIYKVCNIPFFARFGWLTQARNGDFSGSWSEMKASATPVGPRP